MLKLHFLCNPCIIYQLKAFYIKNGLWIMHVWAHESRVSDLSFKNKVPWKFTIKNSWIHWIQEYCVYWNESEYSPKDK